MMNPNALEPILDDMAEILGDRRMYKFLHIPIQSGSDSVLENMNRRFTAERFEAEVSRLRELCPGISIATDIICGFPGETDEDHAMTVGMIRRLGLDTVNITRFSPRPGTKAAEMEQTHGRISNERSKELTSVKNETELGVNSREIGTVHLALATEKGKDGTIMRTDRYRPVVVREDIPMGTFSTVKITEAKPTYLLGIVCNPQNKL